MDYRSERGRKSDTSNAWGMERIIGSVRYFGRSFPADLDRVGISSSNSVAGFSIALITLNFLKFL